MSEYRAVRKDAGGFLDLCFNVEKATEVTMQPIDTFGMDAAILFSDILTVPLGLGQKVWFEEGEGPKLTPIANLSELPEFDETAFLERLNPVFETVGSIKAGLPNDKALIGFCGAPWTLTTYMIEGGSSKNYLNAKSWAYGNPSDFDALIERLVQASIIYLKSQCKAGAEVLQIFDSWAGALDEYGQQRWSFEPMAKIAAGVKADYPDVKIIAFARNVGVNVAELCQYEAIDALSLDHTISLEFARDKLQPHKVIQGNLDPISVVAGGDYMLGKAKDICDAWHDGGFIFNLSHGIVPQTSVKHVSELANFLKSYS